jgi:putative endonuclease
MRLSRLLASWSGRTPGREALGRFARRFPARPLGQRGEDVAARWLRRKGYQIVSRQDRDLSRGEIDLVAVDGQTIVFVEVKTRRSQTSGHPADAVDHDKQGRLTRLALVYLKRHDLLEYPARFDVVAVTWPRTARRPTIEHIVDAFPAVGRGQMFS